MQTNKRSVLKIAVLPAILALSLIFSSCARKISFGVSPVVPAAQGSVKIKKDKNNNYTIEVKVKNLAPADRLTPAKKTYIVWMVSSGNGTKNIGQLNSSGNFISKKLKANLKTISSFKPDYLFVTAEDDAQTTYPGVPVVLSTRQ